MAPGRSRRAGADVRARAGSRRPRGTTPSRSSSSATTFFLRPTIRYTLADGWEARVGGEIFQGPRRSFFGRIEDNTGAFVELRYSF